MISEQSVTKKLDQYTPLYLKSVRKLQEKRFVFVKILAIIIPENGAKVSKIKCFQFAQQTLNR